MKTTRRAVRGFTLVEILVTTGLLGLLTAGVLAFVFSTMRYLFTGEQKLLINSDIRTVTNEMVENAREANFFLLYQSFSEQSHPVGGVARRDANNNGAVNTNDRRQAGMEGNFLVFVYYEDPFFDSRLYDGDSTNNTVDNARVTRLVGYWSAPNRDLAGEIAVYKFDTDDFRSGAASSWTTPWSVTFPATLDSATTLESLLPPDTSAWAQDGRFEILVNDARGLSPDQFHFINFQNRSVLVRTKILHGNQAKQVTNTYNFTITPRG
jgi:prepilin-type N-terminal cleavage/methylation domain-containing protein